ncbi:MAG: hypothetical protein K9N34_08645 [Candidatus Marinimicrobia bacterium]|nr:hypothetical protein [Candidatus Neomarinimicrobiota bacterium]MCF7840943.1 hypothetical protein [Candidatus Neomarinimicrobiota bacterium]MCF7902781.1 hypothetical protein [Candidatus Neomarinimicrobiota bacterium]
MSDHTNCRPALTSYSGDSDKFANGLQTLSNDLDIYPNGLKTLSNELKTLPNDSTIYSNGLGTLPGELHIYSNGLGTLPNDLDIYPNGLNCSDRSKEGGKKGGWRTENGEREKAGFLGFHPVIKALPGISRKRRSVKQQIMSEVQVPD